METAPITKHRSCQSHCCVKHGCKYGYDDCPVFIGLVVQDHRCPYCAPPATITAVVEVLLPVSWLDREALYTWVEKNFDELRSATDFDPW